MIPLDSGHREEAWTWPWWKLRDPLETNTMKMSRGEGGAGQGGGWGAGGLTPLECVVETEPGTDTGAGKRSQGLSNHESPSHPYHSIS